MAGWHYRSAAHRTQAPPEAVWRTLLDGRHWSAWNADAEWMVVDDTLVPGAYITIKPARGRQTAFRIVDVDAPARLAYAMTIGPLGRLRYAYTIDRDGADASVVRCEIAIAGALTRWLVATTGKRAASLADENLARLAALAPNEANAVDTR